MKKDIDIAAFGELLIDFTEAGFSSNGMKLFQQNPGGAPANLLTAASHLDKRTAFIGKVGDDMHGAFLRETLLQQGINTNGLRMDPNYFTTLAFVEIDPSGERHFSFARKPGADTHMTPEDLDLDLLSRCRIFHIGSLSLTDDPSRSTTYEGIRIAKENGAFISYDPNYRPSLWENETAATEEMKKVLPLADLLKVSDEECLLLTGAKDYRVAADTLLSMGISLVAVTLGAEGVYVATNTIKMQIPGFPSTPVDTTGAGDSFWGGFLSTFLEQDTPLDLMSADNIQKCAVTGNAVAALCVRAKGGIPSIPSYEAIHTLLDQKKTDDSV